MIELTNKFDFEPFLVTSCHKDLRGVNMITSRLMAVPFLYTYCVGINSSSRINRCCYEDAAFRVLCGIHPPDHRRISESRRRYLVDRKSLFNQILCPFQMDGMVNLDIVGLVGIMVLATTSNNKAKSHERML